MKEILKRLRNPVVITQLISIISTLVMFFMPDSGEAAVAAIAAASIAAVNVISGVK